MVYRKTLVLLSALLGGCVTSQGPSASVSILVPASSSEAATMREIAVLPFDGPQGADLATDIESMLAGIRIGNTPYFQVIERNKLDKVLKELNWFQSETIKAEHRLRLGKMLGIKALYMGVVSMPVSNETAFKEVRTECLEYKKGKGAKKIFQTCSKSKETNVSCKVLEVTYSITPKLIEVESGRILYSNTFQETLSEKSCEDGKQAVRSQGQLLGTARANVLNKFRREVAPAMTNIALPLMEAYEELTNETARKKFTAGVEFAKAGRMERACEFWREVDSLQPGKIATDFNLAICREVNGEFEHAKQMYIAVERRLEMPDQRVTAAISRIEERIHGARKMQRQLNGS